MALDQDYTVLYQPIFIACLCSVFLDTTFQKSGALLPIHKSGDRSKTTDQYHCTMYNI